MKVVSIVGARPNFVKIAPIIKEFEKHPEITNYLVHTGQHYDFELSKQFFEDLYIPEPDLNLEVGSGLHGEQTAKVLEKLEKVLIKEKPDLVLVVGDVNSTLAATLCAAKLNIKVAHVEAGLRSYDKTMPEEINRIVTDHLADILFTTFESASNTLQGEGIDKNKIHFVGNVMIDCLIMSLPKINETTILSELGLKAKEYCVVTMHRPSNVDIKESLVSFIETLKEIGKNIKVVFSIHPRTQKSLETFGLYDDLKNLENTILIKPMSYTSFISLLNNSKFALTDSGGIQEETTFLNVPCITLRENTERPETANHGTNVITGNNKEKILEQVKLILDNNFKKGVVPPLWDGKASERIVKVLIDELAKVRFQNRTMLVTGGCGAIGSILVHELVKLGSKVVVVDDLSSGFIENLPKSKSVVFFQGSILDDVILNKVFDEKPEVVFHLAARFANQNSVENPVEDLKTNILGTLKLLQYAVGSAVKRFVYASSSCVYGNKEGELSESDVYFQLDTPYAISKLAGEYYVRFFQSFHGLNTVILRYFNSYGPIERPGRYRNVIPNFISKALNNESLVITGTGNETRDFTYVFDVVNATIEAAVKEEAIGGIFNIGNGKEVSIIELANIINKLTNSSAKVILTPRRAWDHVLRRKANISRAKTILGYSPKTCLEKGLAQTVEWFRQNKI